MATKAERRLKKVNQIRELVEQKKIVYATLTHRYQFCYESVCPVCGKPKVMYAPIYVRDMTSEKLQKELEKTGTALQIDDSFFHFEDRFKAIQDRCACTYYSGHYPEASEQYRKLVETIKADCPHSEFAISDDGILYRLEECPVCGNFRTVNYDFGFAEEYRKSGFFYLFKVIPEGNIEDMLGYDGIKVSRLLCMADDDLLCKCGAHW